MAERMVMVMCYCNGCIKYGPDGVYYEGPTPKKMSVKQNTELSRLLDGLYPVFGLDKQRSKLDIFGKYPVAVSPSQFRYIHLPVVNDISLVTMLEVPSKHPSINCVELYIEVEPTSDDVVDPPATCSSPLENPGSCSKRQRTQPPVVKLERDNGLEEVQGVDSTYKWIEDVANAEFGNGSTHGGGAVTGKNSGLEGMAQGGNGLGSNAPKPLSLSSLWVDDHELRVGLRFKDRDELKKAVEWCSIRGQQKCVEQETGKDEYTFECIRWKCKWSLCASRREVHGECFEITKFTGPHTCCPGDFKSEFLADEIERVVRVQPTVSVAELKKWWKEKTGYKLKTPEMTKAKLEAIKRVYGDWDQSFRLLPKLMATFQSSNGLVVDWQYDTFPNSAFASFRGVFWAFSQSIQGFPHCRPLVIVDTKDLNGKYPMKLIFASGLDADDCYFPLAYAVTKEVSIDTWRWFLTGIRDKVTQREGLCLISCPHPDILAVINEPGSLWKEPWAYHRFCLDHVRSQFLGVFKDYHTLDNVVRLAGSTNRQDEFDSHMDTIKRRNSEAREWLDKMAPHQWALAHDGGRRYGIMTLDPQCVVSVLISSQSLGLPVTATALLLFDELRSDFENGVCESRGRLKRGDMYTELVTKKLKEFTTASVTYDVMPLDNNMFQVTPRFQKDGWIVQLSEGTCTCGKFQRKKFPCLHALAVCEKLKINPLQYVDECYSVERYHKTYAAAFNAVPEVSAWPEASGVPTLFPPVIPPPPPPPPPTMSGKSKQARTPRTGILKKKS